MIRYFSVQECAHKALTHFEIAALARRHDDLEDARRNMAAALRWEARAEAGGWTFDSKKDTLEF